MTFEEAEARFRQLQSRVQRGESISRAEYEEQVSQLAVQDPNGVLWEINPRTGKWMYFDGAEWVSGTPPGHDTSQVIPAFTSPPPPASAPAAAPVPSAPPAQQKPMTASVPPPPPPPSAPRPVAPAAKPPSSPESVQPYRRVTPERPAPASKPPVGTPPGGTPSPQRPTSASPFTGREWVPFAVAAVVLLLCAVIVLVGGNLVLSSTASTRTPTPRIALVPTATAVPTIVRLPSPTPIPPTPAPVLAKVTERTVNVRAAPNTKAKIIGSVKRDNQLTLVARSEDALWYQINLVGAAQPGWIFGETIQITSGNAQTLPVAGGATPTPARGVVPPPPATGPAATPTVLGVIPTRKP